MKTRITMTFLLALLALAVAVPMFAQEYQYEVNPCGDASAADMEWCLFGDYTGSGTGTLYGNGPYCLTCELSAAGDIPDGWASCVSLDTTASGHSGATRSGSVYCQAINTSIRAYCQLSGPSCGGYVVSTKNSDEIRAQIDSVTQFIVAAKLMSRESLANWMGDTEDRLSRVQQGRYADLLRLKLYLDKFKSLTGDTLRPGAIPVLPIPHGSAIRRTAVL